jgi:hypothetical protein
MTHIALHCQAWRRNRARDMDRCDSHVRFRRRNEPGQDFSRLARNSRGWAEGEAETIRSSLLDVKVPHMGGTCHSSFAGSGRGVTRADPRSFGVTYAAIMGPKWSEPRR